MNSIESYSPPKVTSLDGDAKDPCDIVSDPTALETLRAMMGGIVPQQLDLQSSTSSDGQTLTELLSLLTKALNDEGIPASLAPLVQSLAKSLSAKASTASTDAGLSALRAALGQTQSSVATNAAELAQMDQLLAELEKIAMPSQLAGTSVAIPDGSLFDELRLALAKALSARGEQPAMKPTTIEQQPNEASLGQSILQSLGAQSSAAASNLSTPVSVNGTPTVERVEQVSALMTEMADRVLVTDPIHGQIPEVRVKLADNVMPGTEVRVWRENGGELRVSFDTNSAYWARVLNDASPLLAQRLNDRLPLVAPPQIVVQQQGGQPEDGRSRNRQNPWEVEQDAAEA